LFISEFNEVNKLQSCILKGCNFTTYRERRLNDQYLWTLSVLLGLQIKWQTPGIFVLPPGFHHFN